MTKSKRIFFGAIVTMLALAGCSTMTKAEREAKRAERAEYVKKTLDDRHYKIDIDMMHTRRIGSKPVSSDWSLEVKGDTLVSYLPYFGVAYEATYGSSRGLNFTAPIKGYEDTGFNNGRRTIRLQANSDEDVIDYRLEVMDNGRVAIDVTPHKREGISYSGNLD